VTDTLAVFCKQTGTAELAQQLRLGTALGPHALHSTGQPACHRTKHLTVKPSLTRQNS
jgi:hypothetical protein